MADEPQKNPVWKVVGVAIVIVVVDPIAAHDPITVPEICNWLEIVWLTVILLYKQQHDEVKRHPLSIKNVPVQFGVVDITPIQVVAVVLVVVVLGQAVVATVTLPFYKLSYKDLNKKKSEFELLVPHLVTPIGTAIAITSIIPINKPIQRPIKHPFEQKFDFLLK